MSLLGPNIKTLIDICGGKFSLKTSLLLIFQVVNKFLILVWKTGIHTLEGIYLLRYKARKFPHGNLRQLSYSPYYRFWIMQKIQKSRNWPTPNLQRKQKVKWYSKVCQHIFTVWGHPKQKRWSLVCMLHAHLLFEGEIALGGVPEVIWRNKGKLDPDKKTEVISKRALWGISEWDRERDNVLSGVVILRGSWL